MMNPWDDYIRQGDIGKWITNIVGNYQEPIYQSCDSQCRTVNRLRK